jgi:hypothetical protein
MSGGAKFWVIVLCWGRCGGVPCRGGSVRRRRWLERGGDWRTVVRFEFASQTLDNWAGRAIAAHAVLGLRFALAKLGDWAYPKSRLV